MIKKNKLNSEQTQISTLVKKATAYHQQGNFEEAQFIYEQILSSQPNHFDALQLLGVLFAQTKKYSQAIEFLSKAIDVNSNHAGVFNNRGIALKELKRFEEALASYDQAIMIKRDHLDVYNNRGNVLQELKRLDEALVSYDQAIAIKPDYVQALSNRGNILQKLKRLDDARASYNMAIIIDPEFVDAHWNLSLCNLRMGNFSDGWQGYKWRLKIDGAFGKPLKSNMPNWDFKKTNKRLLLSTEQGVGDIIFFGRFLSELQKNIPNLLVQIDKRLVSILQRSLPQIKFYPADIDVPESSYDIHSPIASLGEYFNHSKINFLKSKNHYLISDKKRTKDIRDDLSINNKLLCGISWKSQSPLTGHEKSLSLEKLASVFNSEKIRLVNLQYGETEKDINFLRSKSDIELIQYSSVDNFNDLDGLASLIDACDFIVTVDNVTIQISAALGKESFVLLTHFPHYFWPLEKKESILFPDLKIYRQEKINYWDDALEKLKGDL